LLKSKIRKINIDRGLLGLYSIQFYKIDIKELSSREIAILRKKIALNIRMKSDFPSKKQNAFDKFYYTYYLGGGSNWDIDSNSLSGKGTATIYFPYVPSET
jgi:hypothetical protein